MKVKMVSHRMIAGLTIVIAPTFCFATTGTYATGYGTREQGMGGATIAVGQSTMAAATNPAGMAFVGNRFDIGIGVIVASVGAYDNGKDYAARTGVIPLPEFGYSAVVSDAVTWGLTAWSSGGGISYKKAFGDVPGNSDSYDQVVFMHLAPTVTYKFGDDYQHAVAFSLVGALSTFKISGVEAQTQQKSPDRDWSPGYGYKIGWLSQFTPAFSMGAFYSSKIRYQPWSNNATILPDGARYEEAEQYGVGFALKPDRNWLLALDWVRFNYANTRVLGNDVNYAIPLGSPNGPGFGLANINVYRFGVEYQFNERLKLRTGFEYSQEPLQPKNTAFNFLLPVTATRTYTLGASYKVSQNTEVSLAYALSPEKRVAGEGVSEGVDPYSKMNYFALSYSKTF